MSRISNGQFTLNPQEYYSSRDDRKQLHQIGKIVSINLSRSGYNFSQQLIKMSPLKKEFEMQLNYPFDAIYDQQYKVARTSNFNQEQPLHKKIKLKQSRSQFTNSQINNYCRVNEGIQCFDNQQYRPIQSSTLKTSFRVSGLSNSKSFVKQKKDIGKISNKSLQKLWLIESPIVNDKSNDQNTKRQKSPGFLSKNKHEQGSSSSFTKTPQIAPKVQLQLNKKEKLLKRLLQRNRAKSKRQTRRSKNIELPSVYKINNNILKFRQFVQKTHDNYPLKLTNKTPQNTYYVFSQPPFAIQKDRLKDIKIHKKSSKYLQAVHSLNNQEPPLQKVNFSDKRKNRFSLQNNNQTQVNIKKIQRQKSSQNSIIKNSIHKSRQQIYDQQVNKYRKPMSVNKIIDAYPQQKLIGQFSQIKNQFSQFQKYFQFLSNSNSSQQQITQQIQLNTKISVLKTLLIDVGNQANLKIMIPKVLLQRYLNNSFMTTLRYVSTSELHSIFQLLLNQVQNQSKIVKIIKFNNCMFVSARKNIKSQNNKYFALLWHFSGNIYLGDWIQNSSQEDSKTTSDNLLSSQCLNSQTKGFRQGKGLQICLSLSKKDDGKQYKEAVQIYFGQFKKNQKHGYGVKMYLNSELNEQNLEKVVQQKLEIGCWQDDLRHGWIKTFIKNKLSQNGEYSSDAFISSKESKKIKLAYDSK